jgi:hypothetical protein
MLKVIMQLIGVIGAAVVAIEGHTATGPEKRAAVVTAVTTAAVDLEAILPGWAVLMLGNKTFVGIIVDILVSVFNAVEGKGWGALMHLPATPTSAQATAAASNDAIGTVILTSNDPADGSL